MSTRHCASCRNLTADDDSDCIVTVQNRGATVALAHCSTRCGLATVLAFRPGPTFECLHISGFDAYDLAILQKALRGQI